MQYWCQSADKRLAALHLRLAVSL